MTSKYIIRKVNWKNCDKNGVPRDFLDVKEFFNRALKKEKFPLVWRRNKITYSELKTVWVLSKNKTISYVAYSKKSNKVVGSGTVFVEGKYGEYRITIDPYHIGKGLGKLLTKRAIAETLKRGLSVKVNTSVENRSMISVMESLGYKEYKRVKNYKPYVNNVKAKTFDVYQWRIKPR